MIGSLNAMGLQLVGAAGRRLGTAVLMILLAGGLAACGQAKLGKKPEATESSKSEEGRGRSISEGLSRDREGGGGAPTTRGLSDDETMAQAPDATEAAPPPPPPAAAPPPTASPTPRAERPGTRSFARPAPPKATAPGDAGGAAAPPPVAAAPSGPAPGTTKPGTAVVEEKTDWDVVPVFFGTDRGRETNAKRISYGADRGRRLELGRALVTVPKAHEVPNIERPWAIKVPYFDIKIYEQAEDPKQHFTMKEVQVLPRDQFLAFVRERLATSSRYKDHAVIFVHGYNTAFDSAIYRTAQMSYDLKFDGATFLYSWPSGGTFESYTYDRESAGQAQPFMRDFLDLVVKETGAKSVSIIAHSMGNQPVLQILRDLKFSKPENVVISQIILAAPDVDRDNFENIAREIKGMAGGVTLYAASNDRALSVSRRFNGGIPRAGDVPATGPMILSGIDTIDVTAAGMEGLYLNHSSYAENNALLADIGLIIQTGERPPDKRFPLLQKVTIDRGEYWKYPPRR